MQLFSGPCALHVYPYISQRSFSIKVKAFNRRRPIPAFGEYRRLRVEMTAGFQHDDH